MLISGVPVVEAVEITASVVGNAVYESTVLEVAPEKT